MTAHNLKHLASEVSFISALLSPLAFLLALLIGLAGWLVKGWVFGLWLWGIALGISLVVLPVAIRITCGPDTRVVCEFCRNRESYRLNGRHGTILQKDKRG